ncbi:uncharacterized protein LOC132548151 [Ylistrum balloti]|uniref:uncharacterized protein LOC132548151 n=1 Tax=Ylistrum balloti TaxID=509963 RepID=UPI002905C20F|nr:uncharacterized protein LOC132548151 [Ylistrum balloti]
MATCLTISGGISRVFLIVVNASGLVFALFLIVLASDLRVNPDDNSFGNEYESTEKALLSSIVSRYSPTIDTTPISSWHIRDADIFNTFFFSMWLGGGILLIISAVGLIVAARKINGGLLVHGGFLLLLLLTEIIFYGMLADNTVDNGLNDKVPLKSSIQASMYTSFQDYGGVYETDVNSIGWSFIMLKYDCCGVYGWTQYNTLTKNINRPIRVAGNFICCKQDQLKQYLNASCWPNDVQSSDKMNCYDAIVDAILSSTFLKVLPVIYVVQFVLVIGAILIILDNKYSVAQVEPEKETYPDKQETVRPTSEKRAP